MNKAIIFDRDGTLIVDKVYLNDPNQIEYLPFTIEGLTILKNLGFLFFVATNQSGIPRGLVQIENLHKIHEKINSDFKKSNIEIQHFYYAPYMTDSNHPMRKPNPGMLLQAAKDYDLDLTQCWMMGDKDVDVEAGTKAGCKTLFITGTMDPELLKIKPNCIVNNMLEAAQFIKSQI